MNIDYPTRTHNTLPYILYRDFVFYLIFLSFVIYGYCHVILILFDRRLYYPDYLESPGKKAKTLNETYCHPETDGPSAWLSHR